jgi:transportin-1
MAWQPEAEPLRQLVQCLSDSLSSGNSGVRQNAEIVSVH